VAKVTNVNNLEDGDAILLVYEGENCAMSTSQGDNNRSNSSITLSENKTYAPSASVQKIILVKAGDYYFFYCNTDDEVPANDGYLYAASSSSNQLKTTTTPNNNAKASISISSGNATITFQGSNTRNIIRFNTSDGQKKFSCYSSTSDFPVVQIYKEVPAVTVSSAGWTTYVAPENVSFPYGVSGYIASITSSSSIHLTEILAAPKGTAVVIKAAQGTYPLEVVAADACDDVDDNILQASDGSVTGNGSTIYALGVGKEGDNEGKVGFFLVNTDVTVPAGKAYLTYSGSGPAPSMIRIEDEVEVITNIENIEANEKAVKFIENGRILILRDGITYDALGRKIR